MPTYAWRLLASIVYVSAFASDARGQQKPDGTPVPATPPTTAEVVIQGGRTDVPAVTRGDVPTKHYWVTLAAVDSTTGRPTSIPVSDCAATSVRFEGSVSKEPGGAPAHQDRPSLVVSEDTLKAWGGDPSTLEPVTTDDDSYCVSYAYVRLANVTAPQHVTARLTTRSSASQAGPHGLGGGGQGGASYAFSPTRVDTTGPPLVIVDRSVGSSVAYAGSQLDGTYLVALGRIPDDGGEPVRPTPTECANARVRFSLLAPKEAGVTALDATVSAHAIDDERHGLLLPNRKTRSHTILASGGHDDLSACVASVPVRLGPQAGLQTVTASVVGAGLDPGATTDEARLTAGTDEYAGRVRFQGIRAHARPRAMVGVLYVASGTAEVDSLYRGVALSDSTLTIQDTVVVDSPKFVPMVGADVPLQPVVNSIQETVLYVMRAPLRWVGLRSLRPSRFINGLAGSFRLQAATRLTGDFGRTVYLGLSLPSAGGLGAGNVPFDFTIGASFDTRNDWNSSFAATATIDVNDALGGIKSVFGL